MLRKQKSLICSYKLGSQDFWQIGNSVLSKGKYENFSKNSKNSKGNCFPFYNYSEATYFCNSKDY